MKLRTSGSGGTGASGVEDALIANVLGKLSRGGRAKLVLVISSARRIKWQEIPGLDVRPFVSASKETDPSVVDNADCVVLCKEQVSHKLRDKLLDRKRSTNPDCKEFHLTRHSTFNRVLKRIAEGLAPKVAQPAQIVAPKEPVVKNEIKDSEAKRPPEPAVATSQPVPAKPKTPRKKELCPSIAKASKEEREAFLLDLWTAFEKGAGTLSKFQITEVFIGHNLHRNTSVGWLVNNKYIYGKKKEGETSIGQWSVGERLTAFIKTLDPSARAPHAGPTSALDRVVALREEQRIEAKQALDEVSQKLATLKSEITKLEETREYLQKLLG